MTLTLLVAKQSFPSYNLWIPRSWTNTLVASSLINIQGLFSTIVTCGGRETAVEWGSKWLILFHGTVSHILGPRATVLHKILLVVSTL